MLKALKNEKIVYAWEVDKNLKPFICPECKKELGIRKGKIKIHHFYHIHKFNCNIVPESFIHLKVKYLLYQYLKKIYEVVEIEHKIEDRIADVFYINKYNKKVVYEIQKSNLSVEDIKKRTDCYINNNIYVIWVLIKDHININLQTNEIKLNAWQLFLLKLYKGKIYVYDNDCIYIYYLSDIYRENENYDKQGNYYFSNKKLKTLKDIYKIEVSIRLK